ncbi:MAG TPA: hypothetical protein VKB56_12880 [Terriglobales bacterium]|nr:hypothetical protein [Terriglobales bacterium]
MRDPNTTYVTLSGLPVRFELQWPFHLSQSGADWYSLHGRVSLDDGGPLHADVAINLTQTIKEALPSLEPEHAEAVVINAVRKDIDNMQLELLKSGKRQPVPVSSRHFNFKTNQLIFVRADDQQIRDLLLRKSYWTATRRGPNAEAWMADPIDVLYVNSGAERLLQAARSLEAAGMIRLRGEGASALPALLAQRDEMESTLQRALGELEAKHAFERG